MNINNLVESSYAIITKDVEPYSIVGEVPAKDIHDRVNLSIVNSK